METVLSEDTADPVPVQVDAHHHLWRYTAHEFGWIDDRMAALRRDFTVGDLERSMQSAGVGRAVAVQARESLDDTRFLLEAARSSPRIAGVVGWLPLADPAALDQSLAEFAAEPRLRGVRHIVQAEYAGFLDAGTLDAGLRALTGAGLTYDLLLRADQLEEATRFVDRHPNQPFVLDHLAKPRIAARELEPWRSDLRALARRTNVCCKLSGMVTEDDWQNWSLDSLRPYLDIAVEAFGAERLLAGSDWPVCLVASTYRRWWSTLGAYFAPFSTHEREAVFGGNAVRFYGLAAAGEGSARCR